MSLLQTVVNAIVDSYNGTPEEREILAESYTAYTDEELIVICNKIRGIDIIEQDGYNVVLHHRKGER